MEYLISHLLTNVLGPQLLPRAPWDPYARGNVVEAALGQPGLQPRLWEHAGRR